jgi:hypothetical protein
MQHDLLKTYVRHLLAEAKVFDYFKNKILPSPDYAAWVKGQPPAIQGLINTVNKGGVKAGSWQQAEEEVAKELLRNLQPGDFILFSKNKTKTNKSKTQINLPFSAKQESAPQGEFIENPYKSRELNKFLFAYSGQLPDEATVLELARKQTSKFDVLYSNSNVFKNIEVKYSGSGFDKLPSASSTGYDYYALISSHGSVFVPHSDYFAYAKSRSSVKGKKDFDFYDLKVGLKNIAGTTERLNALDDILNLSDSEEEIVNTYIKRAIIKRLLGSSSAALGNLPFTINGHKLRADLKFESREHLRQLIREELTQSDINKVQSLARRAAKDEMKKAFGGDTFKQAVEKEITKALGKSATKQEIAEITKKVMIKLYRELSYTYRPVIDRIKI